MNGGAPPPPRWPTEAGAPIVPGGRTAKPIRCWIRSATNTDGVLPAGAPATPARLLGWTSVIADGTTPEPTCSGGVTVTVVPSNAALEMKRLPLLSYDHTV